MAMGFHRDLPSFSSLREFLDHLRGRGELTEIDEPVSTVLEATEVHRRVIAAQGPVLSFKQPVKADGRTADIPLVVNLFGTRARVAAGLGTRPEGLSALGAFLADLRQPAPPRGVRDALTRLPLLRAALRSRPEVVRRGPAQAVVRLNADVDLGSLPIQTCWPDEPAPLITWPVVITRPPDDAEPHAYNLGIYRMQVLGPDRAIVRWLPRRGGARHHREWLARGEKMPVAVAIGVDPALILSAVIPATEDVSEYLLAGVLRGARTRLINARTVPLLVPADAEIVLEGFVEPGDVAPEGPYGDHTGYYNAVADYPVMTITAITHREQPVYISTFTGRAPDEPTVLGAAMTDVFLPFVRRTFPEVADCWLVPEACSYRVAVISIRKTYPGQARRLMMGLWSLLPQFLMTKMVIVVDDDIDARRWDDVIWAMSTRMDPGRDLMVLTDTPMDPLDFASPDVGLAGKLGIDATRKIGPETAREWGKPLTMPQAVIDKVAQRLPQLLAGRRVLDAAAE